jgi:hypothetical protein
MGGIWEISTPLKTFHLELTTVLFQPPPLSRVFFWNRLHQRLTRGSLAVIETMNEPSEGVSDHQQTDLVAEMTSKSLFEHGGVN